MSLLTNMESLISNIESSIYIGSIPTEAPDNTCGLFRILGRSAELNLDGIDHRNPSVRVLVRDTSYDRAESRMEAILNAFSEANHTGSNPEIMSIVIESDVVSLGLDDKNRAQLYCNLMIKCR